MTMIVALFIAACENSTSNKTENHNGHDHAMHDGHDHGTEGEATVSSGAVELNDDKLNMVFQEYLKLKDALVNSNVEEAKIAASAVETAAKNLEGGMKIVESANGIANAVNLEDERTAFFTLSNELIEMVKKDGVKSGEVYVDFCSMAFNDTGAYWLSTEKGITNPYWGDKMMKCGEVKETLK